MKICTIIIPILNEEKLLKEKLRSFRAPREFNICFVDGGSKDQSLSLIAEYLIDKEGVLLKGEFKNPSIGKGILLGLTKTETDYVLLYPFDCVVSEEQLELLLTFLKRGLVWGGFQKTYSSKKLFYKLYSFLQNKIRTGLFHHFVWTNLIFGKTMTIKKSLSDEGFLEDVLLSDRLKKKSHPFFIQDPIIVSERKYRNRSFKRASLNFLIIMLYRLRFRTIGELKELYR